MLGVAGHHVADVVVEGVEAAVEVVCPDVAAVGEGVVGGDAVPSGRVVDFGAGRVASREEEAGAVVVYGLSQVAVLVVAGDDGGEDFGEAVEEHHGDGCCSRLIPVLHGFGAGNFVGVCAEAVVVDGGVVAGGEERGEGGDAGAVHLGRGNAEESLAVLAHLFGDVDGSCPSALADFGVVVLVEV